MTALLSRMDYRRAWHPGGIYFFTMNPLVRHDNSTLTDNIAVLKNAIRKVKLAHPFEIHAWEVLPDHMHGVIELPQGESDFATRIRLIKAYFSKALPMTESRSEVRLRRCERGIWQRRYWEHLIKNEADYQAHVDDVHINPVKHGLVACVKDWPYSTFHQKVAQGIYPNHWGGGMEEVLKYED